MIVVFIHSLSALLEGLPVAAADAFSMFSTSRYHHLFVSGKRTGFGSKFSKFPKLNRTKTVSSITLRRFHQCMVLESVDESGILEYVRGTQ